MLLFPRKTIQFKVMKMSGGVPLSTAVDDTETAGVPHPWVRTQWNLKSAEAINNQGVIVGNGTWHQTNPYDASAQQWGWILIPQPEALP